MSHPIRPLSCLQSAVFLINSPSHLVTATPDSSIRKGLHPRRTFSRSYGSILPSSFTRVLSSAGYSLPDHLCRFSTMTCNLKLRGFSWKQGINGFHTVVRSSRGLSVVSPDLPETPPTHFHQDNRRLAHLAFSVPIAITSRAGILTCFPSTTPFGLALGSTHPARLTLDRNPLVFRRGGFSPPLSLLTSAFALLISPACLSTHLRRLTERSPTTHA